MNHYFIGTCLRQILLEDIHKARICSSGQLFAQCHSLDLVLYWDVQLEKVFSSPYLTKNSLPYHCIGGVLLPNLSQVGIQRIPWRRKTSYFCSSQVAPVYFPYPLIFPATLELCRTSGLFISGTEMASCVELTLFCGSGSCLHMSCLIQLVGRYGFLSVLFFNLVPAGPHPMNSSLWKWLQKNKKYWWATFGLQSLEHYSLSSFFLSAPSKAKPTPYKPKVSLQPEEPKTRPGNYNMLFHNCLRQCLYDTSWLFFWDACPQIQHKYWRQTMSQT